MNLVLEATKRTESGKKDSKRLRKEGQIPCNLYGADENIGFYAPYNSFLKLVYTADFQIVELNIEGREAKAIIQEIQFHPVTDKILHIDFLELTGGSKVIAEIPINLIGRAIGEQEGGKVQQRLRKLKIKCLPKKLVEHIEVSVEHLALGKSVKVSELDLEEMEILTPAGTPMASVHIPRAAKSALAAEEEAAEGEEGVEGEEGEGGEAPAEGGGKEE